MEIERKYLITTLPDLSKYKKIEIEQRYLSFEPEIRIRRKDDSYCITMKNTGTLIREEKEVDINKETYEILLNLAKSNPIKKTRYLIPLKNNLTAELDIYHNNLEGLIVVEVEFNSEKQANNFIKPDWFGEDVTDNQNYKNHHLAKVKTYNV